MERAERMFRAYNEHSDKPWLTYDGKVVPPWSELPETTKEKWRAAAREPEYLDDDRDIDPLFGVHMLNAIGKQNARIIALAFDDLLGQLTRYVPEGRYLATTKTHLEQACFMAKKGMASAPGNHE